MVSHISTFGRSCCAAGFLPTTVKLEWTDGQLVAYFKGFSSFIYMGQLAWLLLTCVTIRLYLNFFNILFSLGINSEHVRLVPKIDNFEVQIL